MYNHVEDDRFIFLMAAMADMSGQESTPAKEKIYAKSLEDIDIDTLEQAVWVIINTRKTASFPKVGEIREAVSGGNPNELAALALTKLEKGMGKIGKYRTAVFDDPRIHAVVSLMGGWGKICSMDADEWKWTRKEFEKLYASLSCKPIRSLNIPLVLHGIADTHNSAHGHKSTPQLAYYGDPAKISDWQRTVKQIGYERQEMDNNAGNGIDVLKLVGMK